MLAHQPFGWHLKAWRARRRLSQLQLALAADVSARHLGFVELGRAKPSRSLILRLAEELEVPLRDRNTWLMAAGFAPVFEERPHDDASVALLHAAIMSTLEAHKPFPAFAVDRHWNVVTSNAAVPELYDGVRAELLLPPVNAMRLTLHPEGMAPRLINLAEWAAHTISRLRREIALTADPRLVEILSEAQSFYPDAQPEVAGKQAYPLAVPLKVSTSLGVLSFFSSVMVFGSPVDIGLSELAVELFYPADVETDRAVRRRVG